jgi:hypothetical protein
MPEDDNVPASPPPAASPPPEASPAPESDQGATEAQGQRALKALIGSGAAEFPMDVQMADMEPAGGEPPPPPPPSPPPSPPTEGD